MIQIWTFRIYINCFVGLIPYRKLAENTWNQNDKQKNRVIDY
jgi:hypothetical protein